MRESLLYEIFPMIRPFSGMMQQEEIPDQISYLLALANLFLGKDVNLNEREFARITKRVIIELSGNIEEYYRQILMKTLSDDEKGKMVKRINRFGIYGKQNLVLKKLGVGKLFKEMKIKKTPYYKDYEKFIEDRNLVHSTEKPILDADLTIMIQEIEKDFSKQIEETETIWKPVKLNS